MLIVMTTRRSGASYLEQTIRSIDEGGLVPRKKLVVYDGITERSDGATRLRADGWQEVKLTSGDDPRLGARRVGWRCLHMALHAGVADLLLLQDDLLVCRKGTTFMHELAVSEDLFGISFYVAHPPQGFQHRDKGLPRIVTVDPRLVTGAQAIKLPRRSLEYLCSRDPFSAKGVNVKSPHLFDDSLYSLAAESPCPKMGLTLPSPVTHVGQISACGTPIHHIPPWTVSPDANYPVKASSPP